MLTSMHLVHYSLATHLLHADATWVKSNCRYWDNIQSAHAVLEGGKRALSAPSLLAVIMETNGSGARYGVDDTQLIELMEQHGFTSWGYCATNRILHPKSACQGSHAEEGNTIFLRNQDEVERRIRAASKTQLINGWL